VPFCSLKDHNDVAGQHIEKKAKHACMMI